MNYFCRRAGKDNLFQCTYVLPDGITHTKGFVKDQNEAQRYLTLLNGDPNSLPGTTEDVELEEVTEKEDRKRIDLTKNVLFSVGNHSKQSSS